MVWVRKGFVFLLSLALLVSLVGLALSVSAKANLTHPQKLETWLDQSNFYSSLVTNELRDAQQSATGDTGAGRIVLSDPPFQAAVRSVFTTQLLKQYTSTVLNSNYAWLEGKTSTPNFTIDLRPAKQKLAQQIGQAVETRLTSLNLCTNAQLAQLQSTLNTDPLAIPCQLPTVNPQTAGTQATAQVNDSESFLNNPVITPNSLNPDGNKQGKPYYQRLSSAPKLYKWGQRLPLIFGGLTILMLMGIFFLTPRRRRGLRRIGSVMVLAGIILVAIKFVADTAFNHAEKQLFNGSGIGQLQHSLTGFLQRLEAQLVKIDLWFGIAFLALGALLLGILWLSRDKGPKAAKVKGSALDTPNEPIAAPPASGPTNRGTKSSLPALKQPVRSKPNKPRRPPRLIQ